MFIIIPTINKNNNFVFGFSLGAECASGYVPFQQSCYNLSDTEASRADAATAWRPGHLVHITSREEQDFVTGLMDKGDVRDVWTGLLKTLEWSDGFPFVHDPCQNIVTNERQPCFRLHKSEDYRWDDYYCDQALVQI